MEPAKREEKLLFRTLGSCTNTMKNTVREKDVGILNHRDTVLLSLSILAVCIRKNTMLENILTHLL